MQKKLIALAIASLMSGGAFAQSNVSIRSIVNSCAEACALTFGHSLSKRINVGINYSKLTNETGAAYSLLGGGTITSTVAGADVSKLAHTEYHSSDRRK